LIVVAIIAILAAILIPYFVRVRAQTRRSACMENIHNIGTALELYYTDNDQYPAAATWDADLVAGGYIRSVPVEPVNGNPYTYATNAGQTTFVLSDGLDVHITAGTAGFIYYRPESGLVVGAPAVPAP
jgi:type II secretory pathway pseudopilin PulG